MLVNFVKTYLNWVIRIGNVVALLYIVIVFISFYEVLMRYLFNSPTNWVHETSISLAAFLTAYGGIYSYALNKHIQIPIITERFSEKIQFGFKIFSEIITSIFIILLTFSFYHIAFRAVFTPSGEFRLERSGSSWNSPFPGMLKITMFLLMLLFTFLILSHLLAILVQWFRKDYTDHVFKEVPKID